MSLFAGIRSGVNDEFILLGRGEKEKLTLVEGLPIVGTFLGILLIPYHLILPIVLQVELLLLFLGINRGWYRKIK